MPKEIEPPQVQLCEIAKAVDWMDRQGRAHFWVDLVGREVLLSRTGPADPTHHTIAHCGIWNRYAPAGKFVDAVNAAAERLWRAAT